MHIAARLRERGLHPSKALGQNFLVDIHVPTAIAEAAAGSDGATVLEIGPGLGALTKPLLARAPRVIAIERDRGLCTLLREDFADDLGSAKLVLHEGDATHLDWQKLFLENPGPYALAGNLPYSITGLLLERATQLSTLIARAVLMVQLEVAERLLAPAGSDAYGALSVFAQAAFEIKRLFNVKPGAFFPRPEVSSTVVLLTPHTPPRALETDAFRAAVRAAFGQRRKTLRNAWRGLYGLDAQGLAEAAERACVSLDARGETLDVEAFARMAAQAK